MTIVVWDPRAFTPKALVARRALLAVFERTLRGEDLPTIAVVVGLSIRDVKNIITAIASEAEQTTRTTYLRAHLARPILFPEDDGAYGYWHGDIE